MSDSISRMDLAEMTRGFLAMHSVWDSPHSFYALTWNGTKPGVHTVAMIDPAIHPDTYPALMASIAAEALKADKGAPIVAFALQIESYAVVKPMDMTPEDAARFEADRINRTFHQRPDRIEQAMVMCADTTGRMWSAAKTRGESEIREAFRPSIDATGDGVMTGNFVDGLDACAAMAAAALSEAASS